MPSRFARRLLLECQYGSRCERRQRGNPKRQHRNRVIGRIGRKTYTCTFVVLISALGVLGTVKSEAAIMAATTNATVVKKPKTFWRRVRELYMTVTVVRSLPSQFSCTMAIFFRVADYVRVVCGCYGFVCLERANEEKVTCADSSLFFINWCCAEGSNRVSDGKATFDLSGSCWQ